VVVALAVAGVAVAGGAYLMAWSAWDPLPVIQESHGYQRLAQSGEVQVLMHGKTHSVTGLRNPSPTAPDLG